MDFPSWGNLFKISPKVSKLRLFRKRNSLESSQRSQFLVDFPRVSFKKELKTHLFENAFNF